MPIPPVQVMMVGGEKPPVNLVYASEAHGVTSGTYTAPTKRSMVVLCWSSQTNPVVAVTSVTIGGHAATNIVEQFGTQVDGSGIWAAMVDPGDPGTWSVVQANIFGGNRCGGVVYTSDAAEINVTHTYASRTVASDSADVGRGGSYVSSAGAIWSSGTPGLSWTGLTEDVEWVVGFKLGAAAHENFTAPQTAFAMSITGTAGIQMLSLTTAVFEP